MRRWLALVTARSRPLALAWLLATTVATLTPAAYVPSVPGGDKLHHLVAYAGLMFLAGLPERRMPQLLATLIAAIAFGGAVELIQPYVQRSGEWGDFVANAAGACIGCGSALLLHALQPRAEAQTKFKNNSGE